MQCYERKSGCPGSADNNCWPYIVWSGTLNSGTSYYNHYLGYGTFNNNGSNTYTNAFTVRCVLDLEKLLRTTATRTTYGQAHLTVQVIIFGG